MKNYMIIKIIIVIIILPNIFSIEYNDNHINTIIPKFNIPKIQERKKITETLQNSTIQIQENCNITTTNYDHRYEIYNRNEQQEQIDDNIITCNNNKLLSSLKICLLIEPSPITYISGYANRFQSLMYYLLLNNNNNNNNNNNDEQQINNDEIILITCDVVTKNLPYYWPSDINNTTTTTKTTTRTTSDNNNNNNNIIHKNIKIYYTYGIILHYLYPSLSVSFDYQLKILSILKEFKPNIVHTVSPGIYVIFSIIYTRLLQIPLIISYHTHLPLYIKPYLFNSLQNNNNNKTNVNLINKAVNILSNYFYHVVEWMVWKYIQIIHSFADLSVVTSPQILNDFNQHNIPRCQIWQKGIDTERFNPKYYNSNMRKRMLNITNVNNNNDNNNNSDENDDKLLLVYIGRLSNEKRIYDLKTILKQLTNDIHLCIIGSGPSEIELKELFLNDPLTSSRTVFLGQLKDVELSEAFASGDIFCMSSDSETLGFVVLESMASGVPVIGIKAGGVQDLIQNNVNGYLIEPNNKYINEFIEKILILKNNIKLRNEMSMLGRIEMEKWTWKKSMEKLRYQQYTQAILNFEQRYERRLWRLLTFSNNKT